MASNRSNQEVEMRGSTLFSRTLIIGFVGGAIWSTFLAVSYYFNFTEIAPKSYLLKPWIQDGWVDRFAGHLIAIIISSLLSLLLAVLYFGLLRKIYSLWISVAYGVVLWIVIFFLVQPLLPHTKSMFDLSSETWVTTLCVFILYGLFVGYSVSYNYHEMQIRIIKQKIEG